MRLAAAPFHVGQSAQVKGDAMKIAKAPRERRQEEIDPMLEEDEDTLAQDETDEMDEDDEDLDDEDDDEA